ncbi:hypothetical protein ED312_23150 [Sinomicrobium pectinilyticum]|uniref:Cell wall anchor protein n=1 Tax=Sinomicrobium pectinilyticum TaxID=1084421 RepID=A0A3N0CZH8_SINP1|nr:hypothetical protein ED312_23150 [Sinomicrobium pectinilyticum]
MGLLFLLLPFIFYAQSNTFPASGNVGIGTENPQSKLDVYGDIMLNTYPTSVANTTSSSFGVVFKSSGYATDGRNRFQYWKVQGVGRSAWGAGDIAFFSNTDGGGYKEIVRFMNNGNVGIGTSSPDALLAVNGIIHSKEVKVDLNGWSDFVFEDSYNLPTLEEVEEHIKEKGHLKDIPSAKEVEENGIFLGEMDAKLLQKIEELTLYMIDLKKENKEQKIQIEELLKQNSRQQEEIDQLKKQ